MDFNECTLQLEPDEVQDVFQTYFLSNDNFSSAEDDSILGSDLEVNVTDEDNTDDENEAMLWVCKFSQ